MNLLQIPASRFQILFWLLREREKRKKAGYNFSFLIDVKLFSLVLLPAAVIEYNTSVVGRSGNDWKNNKNNIELIILYFKLVTYFNKNNWFLFGFYVILIVFVRFD